MNSIKPYHDIKGKIRIGIVDDHKLVRLGLIAGLTLFDDIEIVFEASNGKMCLEYLDKYEIDILLLDITMPVMTGLDALQKIRKANNKLIVILLTMHDESNYMYRGFQEDANAYLLKDSEPEEIYYAIHSCLQFGKFLSNSIDLVLFKQLYSDNKFSHSYIEKIKDFTERELTVLRLICEEKSSPEIAEIMFLNYRTIEGIRSGLLRKIGAKNTVGLALYAERHKLFGE